MYSVKKVCANVLTSPEIYQIVKQWCIIVCLLFRGNWHCSSPFGNCTVALFCPKNDLTYSYYIKCKCVASLISPAARITPSLSRLNGAANGVLGQFGSRPHPLCRWHSGHVSNSEPDHQVDERGEGQTFAALCSTFPAPAWLPLSACTAIIIQWLIYICDGIKSARHGWMLNQI
jgi:hypothetical protein